VDDPRTIKGPIAGPDDIPAGFALGPGGLLVPQGDAPRAREVWREEERKAILAAIRIAERHDLLLMVGCKDDRCAEHPLVVERELEDGSLAWVCDHKVRVLTRPPRPRPARKGFRP